MDSARGEYCYKYPHPAITADCVIFGFDGQTLNVLLVERGVEPYKGMWALPGGFMRMDETIDDCAARELHEETNLSEVYLEQFKVFSSVNRDPRERVVTVAFIALVRPSDYHVIAGDDASKALWFNESLLPPLAFDHEAIIHAAREHLSELIRIKPIAFNLLEDTFTATELQRVYETINRTTYDRRNFLRKAMHSGAIEEADCIGMSVPQPSRISSSSCSSSAVRDRLLSFKSIDDEVAGAPRESRSRRTKLFWFKGRKKGNKRDDSEDASMKDIFNF